MLGSLGVEGGTRSAGQGNGASSSTSGSGLSDSVVCLWTSFSTCDGSVDMVVEEGSRIAHNRSPAPVSAAEFVFCSSWIALFGLVAKIVRR